VTVSSQSDDQEKTEAATPRRQEKAREEGQVARSRELTTFLLLAAGVGSLWGMGPLIFGQLGRVLEQSFLFERRMVFEDAVMLSHAGNLVREALFSLLPFFVVLVLVALAAPLLLGGFLLSGKGLRPQFGRLNPIKGLGRIFSFNALAELGKVLAKSALLLSIAAWFMLSHGGELMSIKNEDLRPALMHTVSTAGLAAVLMVFALIVVVGLDVPHQLWNHAKKLRMSKEEVRREHKEAEGDPQLKARIRSQQQNMARRRMMSKVPQADVIVTNPTHYAVALKYEESRMHAPRVVAKGADAVAENIRKVAREHGVPLLEAPPLARALYRHVDLDREIPVELYTAVAEVLAWAFRLKRARGEGEQAPPPPRDVKVPEGLKKTRARRALR